MISNFRFVNCEGFNGVPNMASSGQGCNETSRTSDNVSNTSDQNRCSCGQDQYMCVRCACGWAQRSHFESASGYISATLALLRWALFTTFSWIRPRRAHEVVEFTLRRLPTQNVFQLILLLLGMLNKHRKESMKM